MERGPHVVCMPEHTDRAPQTVPIPVQQVPSPHCPPKPSHSGMPAGQYSASTRAPPMRAASSNARAILGAEVRPEGGRPTGTTNYKNRACESQSETASARYATRMMATMCACGLVSGAEVLV